jgi:uncharacterized damage-inducible protein DinB
MNATELLDNCHLMMLQALDDLPDEEWDVPGVSGDWSVKDILAHLVSYEYLLIDVLNSTLGNSSTMHLSHFIHHRDTFNDEEVEKRRYDTAQHVLDEYNDVQVETTSLLASIPSETLQKAGIVPALGEERSPNDFVNIVSKHTNEHRAQIEAFRNREAK